MKKYFAYIYALAAAAALTATPACNDIGADEKTPDTRIRTIITGDVYWDQATVRGEVMFNRPVEVGPKGFMYATGYAEMSDFTAQTIECPGDGFEAVITGLAPETLYFVAAYATVGAERVYGPVVSFKTTREYTLSIANDADFVITPTAFNASLRGKVVDDGGYAISYKGVTYWPADGEESQAKDFIVTVSPGSAPAAGATFDVHVTGLDYNTAYKARIWARNAKDRVYGDSVLEFATPDLASADVTTGTAANVGVEEATLSGNIAITTGGDPGAVFGVYLYTESGDTPNASWIEKIATPTPAEGGSYSVTFDELTKLTTYYARAFGRNAKNTTLGEQIAFTTLNETVPTVVNEKLLYADYGKTVSGTEETYLGADYAYLIGKVTNMGGTDAITACGFKYGATPDALINDLPVSGFDAVNPAFSAKLGGLAPGTIVWYSAYAVNEVGTAYGTPVSVATPALKLQWVKDAGKKNTVPGTEHLKYWELDPIVVAGNEQYIFLDRNLGAVAPVSEVNTAIFPGGDIYFIAGMFDKVGDYYKFGTNIPALTVDAAPAAPGGAPVWNNVVDTTPPQDGLDGSNNWTLKQPCPQGYVIPTIDQLTKIMNKYNAVQGTTLDKVAAMKTEMKLQGTSWLRYVSSNNNYTLPDNYNQHSTFITSSTVNASSIGQYLIINYTEKKWDDETKVTINLNGFANANSQSAGMPVRCMRVETIPPVQ